MPTWTEVGISLDQCRKSLLLALFCVAVHIVLSRFRKKKVTKWDAAENLTRRLIKMAPKETKAPQSWTFWVGCSSGQDDGVDGSVCPMYTFTTVEGFWSMYNNMRHPSKLTPGYDFYLFKENIEPKWEDPVCATGGKWTLTFSNGESDRSWMDTLLLLVREEFKHRDEICGASVNVRNGQERIALWTKNAANEAAQVSIGKQWKGFLHIEETMGFTIHVGQGDAEKVGSSANVYTV